MSEMEPYEDIQTDVETPDQFMPISDTGEFNDNRYGRVSSGTSAPTFSYYNESGLPDDLISDYMRNRGGLQEVASVIERWSQSLAVNSTTQTLDVFNRHRWKENQTHMHAVMSRVAWACENDYTLSTLADVVEGLMWAKCRFELVDLDQQDMWNQWAADVNLDGFLRQVGREEFKLSQFYVGLWWKKKVYSVQEDLIEDQIDEFEAERKQREYNEAVDQRTQMIAANKSNPEFIAPPEIPQPSDLKKGPGNRKRKKKFPVMVPSEMTIFDPTKILPVGTLMFGRERFAYIANRSENEAFTSVMNGDMIDETVFQLIEKKYEPTEQDKAACQDLECDPNMLWLFKKDAIFRHTQTRSHYERYAPVRLKTILKLLEMKEHLANSDRASLIGNTNFIVVITKGSDRLPAKASEILNLQEQARMIARLPVLVGDHRLHVEIVAPSVDHTLQDSRWQVLDSRLVFAALRTYSPVSQGGPSGSGGSSGVTEMSRVVAKGLESRRHMIMRTLQSQVFQAVLDRNPELLDEMPTLLFNPKRITLNFQADVIQQVLQLRDRGDISRETALEELNYDQDTEVLRRGRERALYDRIFESQTPFSSPAANPYGPTAAPGAVAGGVPGQAIPGVRPPQLPQGGNQNVVGNGGDPAVGGRGGAKKAAAKKVAKPGGRPAGVTETKPRKSTT